MSLKLNSSGGGSVTLQEPVTASDLTLNLPNASGVVNTSGAVNEVPAGSAAAPAITTTGDTNTGMFFPAADTIAFAEGGVEAMRLDSAGNVGIGTSSPAHKLQVNGAIVSTDGTTVARMVTSGGVGLVSTTSNHPLAFQTNDAERMRIDTSGNLLVGTTSTTGPGGAGVVAGLFRTLSGGGGLSNGQSATLFTITTDTAYLVTAQTANASGLSTVVLVTFTSGGNSAVRTILMQDNGNFFISMSGAAVRITNNLGGIIGYNFSAIRIF